MLYSMIDQRGSDTALSGEDNDPRLWIGLEQMHGAVARGLDADLRTAHGLTLSEFRILRWLAPDSCLHMRMSALAEHAQLSPSGLSRAIERFEERGLVRRQTHDHDRRGVNTALTPAGIILMQEARETHASSLQCRFLGHLAAEEGLALGLLCARVVAANGASCPRPGCPTAASEPGTPPSERSHQE